MAWIQGLAGGRCSLVCFYKRVYKLNYHLLK